MLKPNRNSSAYGRQSIRLVSSLAGRKPVAADRDGQSGSHAKDIRIAKEWLATGAPIADVMTVLEVRHRFDLSPAKCRAHAIEILSIARSEFRPEAEPNPNPKESPYAAA